MDKAINRVPQITIFYWIIKIAATTLGETGADAFSMTLDFGYGVATIIFLSIFFALLAIKLSIKKYDALLYWLVFTSTSIAGTTMCDFMDRTMRLGYAGGSIVLLLILSVILAVWHYKGKSISVESITTLKAEWFYWLAFLFANTLGTAAGDYMADDLTLGFFVSAIIITGSLVVIALMHFYTKISPTVLFWFAFVLTRPFGATFGDFLTKPAIKGGLDLGTIGSSVFFGAMLALLIIRETKYNKSNKLNNNRLSIVEGEAL